ncbi:MAG: hypothetical protein IJU02_07105 [Lachnospiraceae bacterium]|nr:hypothetical protein [Lachnospiraceae bacterium]
MIIFDELKVTEDGSALIVEVSVSKEKYFRDVYLDSIFIDNQDTYKDTGISSTPLYTFTLEGNNKILRKTILKNELTAGKDFNGILYVYVRTKGLPADNTPCGMDTINTVGATLNMYNVYNDALPYLKEIASTCDVPDAFIDYMLKVKAIEAALGSGNYLMANKYWNKFFSNINTINTSCGCGK